MKPIMPFKWKAQRRVPWTLLLGVLALWAMPRSAHAQLYASQSTTNTVGKCDANTGAAINANFITGLSGPMGLALSADGTVLFVANDSNGSVGEYNAATGAAINANFITGLPGLVGLALSADGTALFAANTFVLGLPHTVGVVNTVGKYNATTGAAINANFITEGGGLFGPVLSGIALSGNNLFVELFSPDPSSSSNSHRRANYLDSQQRRTVLQYQTAHYFPGVADCRLIKSACSSTCVHSTWKARACARNTPTESNS